MAGDAHGEDPNLKGLARIFNGSTMNGRANVAKATYGFFALVIAYNMLKPKKK